jgi:hypothetical protein
MDVAMEESGLDVHAGHDDLWVTLDPEGQGHDLAKAMEEAETAQELRETRERWRLLGRALRGQRENQEEGGPQEEEVGSNPGGGSDGSVDLGQFGIASGQDSWTESETEDNGYDSDDDTWCWWCRQPGHKTYLCGTEARAIDPASSGEEEIIPDLVQDVDALKLEDDRQDRWQSQ